MALMSLVGRSGLAGSALPRGNCVNRFALYGCWFFAIIFLSVTRCVLQPQGIIIIKSTVIGYETKPLKAFSYSMGRLGLVGSVLPSGHNVNVVNDNSNNEHQQRTIVTEYGDVIRNNNCLE